MRADFLVLVEGETEHIAFVEMVVVEILPVTLNTFAISHTLPSIVVILLLYHILLLIARCRVFIFT